MNTSLKFILTADATQFNAQMRTVQANLAAISGAGTKVGDNVDKGATKARNALTRLQGVALSVVSSLGIIAAMAVFAKIVSQGAQFEQAFTGIRKTVVASEAEFSQLRAQILEMARVTPFAATELAKIGQIAGQLGIQAKDIAGFTRVVADLSVAADDLDFEQAAFSLARLAKLTGTTITESSKMSSVIVALGNNMATTEGEITEMSLRLAGAGKVIGLTAPEVLALSANLTQLGIRADAGGTAMSRVFIEMKKAADTGGEALAGFAEVAGMTVDDFGKLFGEEPVEAINQFILGMGKIVTSGGPAFTTLEELGLANIRVSRSVLAAATASQELGRSINIANEAWAKGTAAADEANKFYDTTINKLKALWNLFLETGTIIFDIFKPAIDTLIPALGALLKINVAFLTPLKMLVELITGVGNEARVAAGGVGELDRSSKQWFDTYILGVKSISENKELEKVQQETKKTTEDYILWAVKLSKFVDDADKGSRKYAAGVGILKKALEDLTEEQMKEANAQWSADKVIRKNTDNLINEARAAAEAGKFIGVVTEGMEEAVGIHGKLSEEQERLVAAFEKALRPADLLSKEMDDLVLIGKDSNEVLRVYAERLIKEAEAQFKMGEALEPSTRRWYEQAKAITETKDALEDLMAAQVQEISAQTSASAALQQAMSMGAANIDYYRKWEAVQKALNLKLKEAKDPLKELVEKYNDMKNVIPNLVTEIAYLTNEGVTSEAQIWLLGSRLEAAAEAAKRMGYEIPPAVQELLDMKEAAELNEKALKKVDTMVNSIIADTFRDFTNAIADAVIDWKGFGDSLVDIAKSFGKALIRVLLTELFNPLMGVMKGLAGGLLSMFSGGTFGGGFTQSLASLGGGALTTAGTGAGLAALGLGGGGGAALGLGGGAGILGLLGLGGGGAPTVAGYTGAQLGIPGLAGLGGSGGGMFSSLSAFFTNPWTAVVGGGIIGGILLKNLLSKSPSEKMSGELTRDFGISGDINGFIRNVLGSDPKSLLNQRKETSTLFTAYQGLSGGMSADAFIRAMSNIQFSRGAGQAALDAGLTGRIVNNGRDIIFDLSEAARKAVEEGNVKEFNEQLKILIGSTQFKTVIPNFEQIIDVISGYSGAAGEAARESDILQDALDELRDRPNQVGEALENMANSLETLRGFGATDEEILTLLGQDMVSLVEVAQQLGVELPPSIAAILGLGEAAEEAEESTRGLGRAGRDSARDLEETADAGEELGRVFGETNRPLGDSEDRIRDVGTVSRETTEAIEELSEAFQNGMDSAETFLSSSTELADQIQGFATTLLESGISEELAQGGVWDRFGSTIMDIYNNLVAVEGPIDWRIQQMIEWAIATGRVVENEAGLVEVLKEEKVVLSSAEQRWLRLKDSVVDVAEIYEFGRFVINEMGIDLNNQEDVLRAQSVVWESYGNEILSAAEFQMTFYKTLDDGIRGLLEWALASNTVSDSVKEQIRSLLGLTDAMNGYNNAIEQSVLGAGGNLNPTDPYDFLNTAYLFEQQAKSIMRGVGGFSTSEFGRVGSDIITAARQYGDSNLFELVADAIGGIGTGTTFRDAFIRLLTGNGVVGPSSVPSFQSGTDYVPKNTLAYLHKGERVVPAGENVGMTFNIYTIDGADVERVVRKQIIPELQRQKSLRRI